MRTQYLRMPRPVKSLIAPVLNFVPHSIRFGKTYKKLREEIARSETDSQFVEQHQLEALRNLLRRTSERSRHFSSVIKSSFGSGFNPAIFSMKNLSSLPILTKAEIANDPEAFLIADAGDYDIRSTSGSSGRPPAQIYMDRGRSVREMAYLHHIWSRIGYQLGDGRAVIRDYGGFIASAENTWRYDPALRELWLSPFHLTESVMDQYLELLHRYQVRFIFAYSSSLYILGRHAARRQWKPPSSLRGLLPASETLFSYQRELLARCFGVPILSHYGMSERVAIAGEISQCAGTYEFEPLYGLVELVDEKGDAVRNPGKRGRLVSTGLFNKAMALIRYDTGDRATLVQSASRENKFRLRVSDIRSRWNQEFVVGYDGQKIPVIGLDRENYFGIFNEYQYVQSVPGKATLRVVPCMGATKAELHAVVSTFQDLVRGVVDIDLEIVSSIPVGLTGKRNFVQQQLSIVDD